MKVLRVSAVMLMVASLSGYAMADTVKIGIIAPFRARSPTMASCLKMAPSRTLHNKRVSLRATKLKLSTAIAAALILVGLKPRRKSLLLTIKSTTWAGWSLHLTRWR